MSGLMRGRIALIIVALVLLGMGSAALTRGRRLASVELCGPDGSTSVPDREVHDEHIQDPQAREPAVLGKILVHVTGEVQNPDLYVLDSDARIAHALEAAGGATARADLNQVNLALQVRDGQQIFVPAKQSEHISNNASSHVLVPEGRLDPSPQQNSSAKADAEERFPLNINRASADELCRLPGVGPITAANIVDYRNRNGSFAGVDELLNVSGIGPSKLEKIRPLASTR